MTQEVEFHLPSSLDIVQAAESGEFGHPLDSAKHTEWYVALDTIDVYIATKAVLLELARTAPTMRCKDWIQGIIDTRSMYAVVTGVAF